MRFHLDRQTGGLTRAIERGAKGMEFIMTSAFEVVPLLVEVLLVSILLWIMFGWPTQSSPLPRLLIYAFSIR